MDEKGNNKKYLPLAIPQRKTAEETSDAPSQTQPKRAKVENGGLFYQIEYDSCPIKGVGKFVLKPQKIEPREKNKIRDKFSDMRDIVRQHRTETGYMQFFDRQSRHDNSLLFYRQGLFMQDFEDNCTEVTTFSSYFPYYQMMGFEQLRTYFSWRTQLRLGNVGPASVSYAFLYIYELLSNIGVENPQEGLSKLMFFWRKFRDINATIDKYIIRWLKDYHVYYELQKPFKEFIKDEGLTKYYPETFATSSDFDLFCSVSKYDMRKYDFYKNGDQMLISDCFDFMLKELREIMLLNGIVFDDAVFQPARKVSAWQPFKDALFYTCLKQSDRQVVLNGSEIYSCNQNYWTTSASISTESSRRLIGYIIKQMEVDLHVLLEYKHRLSADISTTDHEIINQLKLAGISLEKIIGAAVTRFYRGSTKTVVSVDPSALMKIRQEAMATQEKLVVAEDDTMPTAFAPSPILAEASSSFVSAGNIWETLQTALTQSELQALEVILASGDIKNFADSYGVMLEVLIDGINEKAMDCMGDNLIDEEFAIYDDYMNKVKEMII